MTSSSNSILTSVLKYSSGVFDLQIPLSYPEFSLSLGNLQTNENELETNKALLNKFSFICVLAEYVWCKMARLIISGKSLEFKLTREGYLFS